MKEWLKALPVIGTAMRVQERYVKDSADALAASIGFFGFLSLFPLIAIAVAIAGLVLQGDTEAIGQVARTVTRTVPGLAALAGGEESQIGAALAKISNDSGGYLGWGLVTLLIAGLRIASGAQEASAVVFRVERPSGVKARAQQLLALAVVGVFALAGAAVGGVVGVDLGNGVGGLAQSLALIALAYVIDVALFLVAYRMFTPGWGPPWRVLLPGSMLAGAGWVGLKLFGAGYITRQAADANASFGALGSVIALLLLFYLAGRLYLYGAELAALLGDIDGEPMISTDAAQGAAEVSMPAEPGSRPAVDVPPSTVDVAKLAAFGLSLSWVGGLAARLLRR